MALVSSRFRDDDWGLRNRSSFWDDRLSRRWEDWPRDWPSPRDMIDRFWRDNDRSWNEWPSDWPRMDAIMPRFSDQLDRIDRNWRTDPFWRDLYPRWAEPIFKEGIDVKANIVNDRNKFAVDIDAYQFKPEELQVKTLDDTVVIEGRHEDVRDQDNFTKMYFIRKYQLPADVTPEDITSRIDGTGRLTVEAVKRAPAIENSERLIPIEGPSRRAQSRSSSYSPREEAARAASSARNGDTGYHSSAFRNESRQSNYSTAQDRYGGYDPGFKNGYSSSPAPPPPPPPPVSAPAPPLGSDYRRNELNSRVADSNGFREERRREEYRSESRNGFHRSTSALGRPESSSGWRSDRDYRVESPRSGNGTTVNVPVNVQGPTTSSSSSRTAERNVRILTKSFE